METCFDPACPTEAHQILACTGPEPPKFECSGCMHRGHGIAFVKQSTNKRLVFKEVVDIGMTGYKSTEARYAGTILNVVWLDVTFNCTTMSIVPAYLASQGSR